MSYFLWLHSSLARSILLLLASLLSIGLIAVASATSPLDAVEVPAGWLTRPFPRQLLFVVFGFAIAIGIGWIGARLLSSPVACKWMSWFIGGAALVSLCATMIPGAAFAQRGAARWVRFTTDAGVPSAQPSEIAKVAIVVVLAFLLARPTADPKSFTRGFVPCAVILAMVCTLVGYEDFGTSALLCGLGLIVMFVGGCRWRHLAMITVLGALGLAVLLLAKEYRIDRLRSFLHIWDDPRGAGYQPLQSLIGIVSGGWTGVGIGNGLQKHSYLPESHTDFIFSVICEETGVLGGLLVLLLFAALVWLGIRTVEAAASPFERLLAFGVTTLIALQAAINVAVVAVLVPTKGISLPFISAGGSGTLALCSATGLLTAVAQRSSRLRANRILSDQCLDERLSFVPAVGA